MPEEVKAEVSSSPAQAESQPKKTGQSTNLLILTALLFGVIGVFLGWYLKGQLSPPKPITPGVPAVDNVAKKPKPKQGPLVIGGILPLTGDAASYGLPIQQAALLAQKEINESGGVNGRPIEFIWEDGRCEREDAKAAAERLVKEKKVEILYAGTCSSEFLAAAPIAQAEKIISISASATSPEISKLGKYVFRTSPSDALAGKVAAEYAFNKWGAKTAGIIVEQKDYTLGLASVFEKEFEALGGKVLFTDIFKTGTTDFSQNATKVLNEAPDMVYLLPQTPTPGVLLVKALKEAGVTAKLLTAEVLLIRDAIKEQGGILEGVTGIEVLFDETRPKTRRFLELYKKEYNLDPTYPGFMAGMYDLIYLIKEAYEAVGDDPDKISEYLYNLKDWSGTVGMLNFDRNGDPTLPYSVKLIQGNEAQQVDVYTPGK